MISARTGVGDCIKSNTKIIFSNRSTESKLLMNLIMCISLFDWMFIFVMGVYLSCFYLHLEVYDCHAYACYHLLSVLFSYSLLYASTLFLCSLPLLSTSTLYLYSLLFHPYHYHLPLLLSALSSLPLLLSSSHFHSPTFSACPTQQRNLILLHPLVQVLEGSSPSKRLNFSLCTHHDASISTSLVIFISFFFNSRRPNSCTSDTSSLDFFQEQAIQIPEGVLSRGMQGQMSVCVCDGLQGVFSDL